MLKHWTYQNKLRAKIKNQNINNWETCFLPTGKLEGCIPHWGYDQKATLLGCPESMRIEVKITRSTWLIPKTNCHGPWQHSRNPHPALPKNKGRDAPFGFEAAAGWVAMPHPRSCRDRHCSSSPWGFFQRKVLVSLCLALWWSKNWSEARYFLDMLQWSQINRWRGVLERHHCTATVILILILTIILIILIMLQSVPKASATAVYPFHSFGLKYSARHPSTRKQPCNPPEVEYSLSPSSSDQLLEQHLSDMAPMTAPYSSVSTPHAGHRGLHWLKVEVDGCRLGSSYLMPRKNKVISKR